MVALPFTTQEFFDVFGRYNNSVWPLQYVLLGIGVLIVINLMMRTRPRLMLALLATLWLWMGVVYHLTFFASINPAATAFGILFLVQAAILAWWARASAASWTPLAGSLGTRAGKALIAYALLGYPLIGYLAGHRYPDTPTFGVPCPTTIFTLGVVLWSPWAVRWWVVVIPLLWAVIATSAAAQLSVPQDYGLAVAGVITLLLLTRRYVAAHGPALRAQSQGLRRLKSLQGVSKRAERDL